VRLGFAVKVLGDGGLPSHDTRRWQSGPHLRWSLEALHGVIDFCERHGIRMYRMTAALAPYATHPDLPQFHHQVDECREELAQLGARARAADVRLSTHPSQYIVLNSEDPGIRAAAARDVELQADLLEAMGAGPEAVCVLHVGGATGGFDAALDRFEAGLETLSDRARDRLVIENDDRTFALAHVMELHRRTGLKVVWDILHHHCNDPARRSNSRSPPGPRASCRRSTTRRPRRRWRSARSASAGASNVPGCCPSCGRTPT
jgi:UV DNA damage endonuclease